METQKTLETVKTKPIPTAAERYRDEIAAKIEDKALRELFINCFGSALSTTIEPLDDGTYFAGSGDIHPMWLRDVAEQMLPYIPLAAEDEEMRTVVKGLLARCWKYILLDPYANAFHEAPLGTHLIYFHDEPETDPWVWERKYEVDSLCFPLWSAYRYWKESGDGSVFTEDYFAALRTVVDVWKVEQYHDEKSPYYFIRKPALPNVTVAPHDKFRGENDQPNPTAYTGMTWTGFIGSDDSVVYNYNTPENFFAAAVLGEAEEILTEQGQGDTVLLADIKQLKAEIQSGIQKYCVIDHENDGKIYAYETDGLGHYRFMDDCNIPSLTSLPLFLPELADDPVYQNTRKFIFSKGNPYYYEGKNGSGIGSAHTPEGCIWTLGVAAEILTCPDRNRVKALLKMLSTCDAGRGTTPESFDVSDPETHTREWYPASDSLFAAAVIAAVERFGEISL